MKAVILAGGFGKRLRPITENTPKPLVNVGGKPIIVWQLQLFKKYGIDEFIICVGYLREKIINTLGNGSRYGVKIAYVVEDEPLGTGGAIKNAEPLLKNEEGFFVINGDIVTNLNPLRLKEKVSDNFIGAIAVTMLRSPYGIVTIGENEVIKDFIEKPTLPNYWINAGVYYFKPEVFRYLPEKGDIEKTALPLLAKEGRLVAVRYNDIFWKSIDTYKDLEEAERLVKKFNPI
ncbi:MAG: nucleotidyltransferase [Thermoprotei archaeon]|nr:MAG: nucleotidyltransferase [Thermoprotei archaeon]RLF19668.1 MAG: nucleotidyltransferase [Thermoprotei archaeon]